MRKQTSQRNIMSSSQDSYQDPLDALLPLTRFKNVQAKGRQQKIVTLRELAAAIPGRVAKSKDKLPLIKLATFGDVPTVDGSLRNDANMREVYGIEIDYDAGNMTPSDAVERFRKAGVAAAILTSPSHLRPNKGQRWRGLLPCRALSNRKSVNNMWPGPMASWGALWARSPSPPVRPTTRALWKAGIRLKCICRKAGGIWIPRPY